MSLLENKIALITGAGAGIGRISAQLFSQEGAKIALFSRTKEAVEETADMCVFRPIVNTHSDSR